MADSRSPVQPLQLFRLPPRGGTPVTVPADDCVVALKAIGEETRVRIVGLLLDEPLDVTAIAERVGVSQYNASKHLRILREAGLLEVRKDGRRHLYAVADGIRARAARGRVLDLGCCSFRFEDGATRTGDAAEARRPRAPGARRKDR
jgi:DNA-binding transcriptional ArsR family regulator